MVLISFYGNTLTDSFPNPLETLVGDIIMSTPPNELDGLFIIVLLVLIIYMFSYIRRHK